MTENKRFTVKQRQGATIYSIEDYYGELPLSEGIYYKSNAEKLCKWLNTQHELLNALYNENEQLKEAVWSWSKSYTRVYEKNEQLKHECNYLQNRLDDFITVQKENDELKTQLQNTSDQRDEFHRGARENANRVGKLEKENEQLKGELAHYKLILLSLEQTE